MRLYSGFAFLSFMSVLSSVPPAAAQNIVFIPGKVLLQTYPSELRSTASRLEFMNANKAPPQYPWANGYTNRFIIELQLSSNVPLLGEFDGHFQWRISLPLAVTTLNDIGEKNTAPIINTDYWFGAQAELLHKLDSPWPRNIALRVLPIFHESNHIGDEFSLAIAKRNDFYRVNLSYEAWEIVLGLSEALPEESGNNLNLRFGIGSLWNTDGYYNLFPDDEIRKSTDAYPSREEGVEFFFQINSRWGKDFLSIANWAFHANIEIRNRILLNYFNTQNEERVWTLNSTLGWYKDTHNQLLGNVGFYLRFLYGQNPYGQFREQKDFFSFSIGFSLGV